MKSILFNTDMVRAILEGRKAVTRRVVKPQPEPFGKAYIYKIAICTEKALAEYAPYRPSDIMYVMETWAAWSPTHGTAPQIIYKADGYSQSHKMKWRPSIQMPREAARIFLRVKDVRVERLQDITEEQARAEGAEPFMMTADVDKPDNEKRWVEKLPALVSFPGIWDSTIKPADRDIYGWDANPYVWVIEFERIRKDGNCL